MILVVSITTLFDSVEEANTAIVPPCNKCNIKVKYCVYLLWIEKDIV